MPLVNPDVQNDVSATPISRQPGKVLEWRRHQTDRHLAALQLQQHQASTVAFFKSFVVKETDIGLKAACDFVTPEADVATRATLLFLVE